MDTDERLIQMWESRASKQAKARRRRELQKERIRRDKMGKKRLWGRARKSEREQREAKERNKMKIGAWNVRLLGAKGEGTGQYWKWRCMRALWTKRGWKAALLSDVQGKGKKVEETGWGKNKWTVVYHQKVAVAMCVEWTERWRRGGCKMEKSTDSRSMAIDIPPRGWRKGIRLIAAYAPSGGRMAVAERMRLGVEKLLRD